MSNAHNRSILGTNSSDLPTSEFGRLLVIADSCEEISFIPFHMDPQAVETRDEGNGKGKKRTSMVHELLRPV